MTPLESSHTDDPSPTGQGGAPARRRPILFSGPMVRAILDGLKTQTRRILKIQPLDVLASPRSTRVIGRRRAWYCLLKRAPNRGGCFCCRYGDIGDLLWVRETWAKSTEPENHQHAKAGFTYRADWSRDQEQMREFHWRPSIFMPRDACRIVLEITNVRVQRFQDISESDSRHEGFSGKVGFSVMWDELNAKRGFSWLSNPWVWAITFRRIEA